jgi:predicted AAA+ superfamily ATPase
MIQRSLEQVILSKLFLKKAILLMGPRQVGKTTLLQKIFQNNPDLFWLNGDELDVQNLFSTFSATRFKAILGSKKIVVIDEAQRIDSIGLRLKLIIDTIDGIQLIHNVDELPLINDDNSDRKQEKLTIFDDFINLNKKKKK